MNTTVREDHPEATCGPQSDGSPTCGHASDCATHNEPAYPAGRCTCGKVRVCSYQKEERCSGAVFEVRWGPHPYDDYDLACGQHLIEVIEDTLPQEGEFLKEYNVTIYQDRMGRRAN